MRNILLGVMIFYAIILFFVALPYLFMAFLMIALFVGAVYFAIKVVESLDYLHDRFEEGIDEPAEPKPQGPSDDIYVKLYRALEVILRLNSTQKDPDLKKALLNSRESVVILKDEGYEKHQTLLKSFFETYSNYIGLFHMPKQTEQVHQARLRTRDNLFQIATALERMIEGQMAPELERVDIQNEVLDDQLKNSGLMPSDFEQQLR